MVFPNLTGTDKQIQWASKIRGDIYARLYQADPTRDRELVSVLRDILLPRFFTETSAKYWIDNRDGFKREWWREERNRFLEKEHPDLWAKHSARFLKQKQVQQDQAKHQAEHPEDYFKFKF